MAGNTGLLSHPNTDLQRLDMPTVEKRTKRNDSNRPLIPFIKETVRKDTMQEKHQPSFTSG